MFSHIVNKCVLAYGAESCTQVRAQNGNRRVKSAKFEFYIFSEAFCVLRKFLDP